MILAQLPRADLQLEAWIASPPVRQLRALLRNRINAIVAEHGHHRPEGCWSGPGRAWLASLELPAVSRELVDDDLELIDALQERIDRLDLQIHQRARSDPRVKVLTQLPGIGPFTVLVILSEIDDVSRFASARKLASWAGLAKEGDARAAGIMMYFAAILGRPAPGQQSWADRLHTHRAPRGPAMLSYVLPKRPGRQLDRLIKVLRTGHR